MVGKKYEIETIEQVLSLLQKENYIKMISLIKIYKKEIIFKGKYASLKELLVEFKERVIDYLTDFHTDYKSRISYCRKHGKDVSAIDLNLMYAPLKIRLLKSEFTLVNFQKVFLIFEETNKNLIILEKELKD